MHTHLPQGERDFRPSSPLMGEDKVENPARGGGEGEYVKWLNFSDTI